MAHALAVTQHWARGGKQAIIIECTRCVGRTFVGFGQNVSQAQESAISEHDDWVRAGSPPSTPQGVEMLYRTFGLSSGSRWRGHVGQE
jgi:hypothetical protein